MEQPEIPAEAHLAAMVKRCLSQYDVRHLIPEGLKACWNWFGLAAG